MRAMIVRTACAALVVCLAACSSSGAPAALPSPSPTVVVVNLPRGVTCGHFSDASEVDREAWAARLLGELEAAGEIAPIVDPASFVPGFVSNVQDLCDGSRPSDRVDSLASYLARQALGG